MINKELLTSPECCSRGPPVGWIWIFSPKLGDKYYWKIHRKIMMNSESENFKLKSQDPKKHNFWMLLKNLTKKLCFALFFKCTKVYRSFRSFYHEILCSSIFFVELHLDDVLEVHLVVWFKLLFLKLVDKYNRKINRKMYNLWNKR